MTRWSIGFAVCGMAVVVFAGISRLNRAEGVPPVDKNPPAKIETATFALG